MSHCVQSLMYQVLTSRPLSYGTADVIPQCHMYRRSGNSRTPVSLDNDTCCCKICHGSNLVERSFGSFVQQRSDKRNKSARLHLRRVSVAMDLTAERREHQSEDFQLLPSTIYHTQHTLLYGCINVSKLHKYTGLKSLKPVHTLISLLAVNTGPVEILYVSLI